MQGWAGKILDINLTDGSIETVPLDSEMARLFLGGFGPDLLSVLLLNAAQYPR